MSKISKYFNLAAAGADTTVPEEINSCQCWSPCGGNCSVISGNILEIPGTQYFAVQTVGNRCTYLDYWCMDTNGNVCFKNRANASGQSQTGEEFWSPGGLAWDPINNGVVETIWDNSYRPYANFHCRCQSGTCLHFVTGSQIGQTCSGWASLAGSNATFYQPCLQRFVTFFLDWSQSSIKLFTYNHTGSGNFCCVSPEQAATGVKADNQSVDYDCNANAFQLAYPCNSNSNCIKKAFVCVCTAAGCMDSTVSGLMCVGDGRPHWVGHDASRGVNFFITSDVVLDENSNSDYGALVACVFCSCSGGTNQYAVCKICDCHPNLRGQSNGSALLHGFMDTGYSYNPIITHEYYNGSYLRQCTSQLVWGSNGYVETICLFANAACTRAWRSNNNGAHIACAGWSVVGFGCQGSNGYFLRTFKPRLVS